MKELEPNTIESSELVEQTFNFWFTDNEHIRSPFPPYIRPILKEKAVSSFFNWVAGLNPKAKDEVNDELIAEKFEEVIFETATKLVLTEDEKLTIEYPFLPRLNDIIFEDVVNKTGKSTIVERSKMQDGDFTYMKVILEKIDTKEIWETKFELPK